MNKEEVKFIFDVNSLDKFRRSLTDLSKISQVIKIKFKEDKMVMYAMETSGNITLAFKCYTYLIQDFFNILENDLTKDDDMSDEFNDGSEEEEEILEFDWIIGDVKSFYKKLSFYGQKDMKGMFVISERNDTRQVNEVKLSDGRYKFSFFSSEAHVVRDISIDQLNGLMDVDASDMKMSFPTEEFNSAKKAAVIDSEDVVCLKIEKNRISIKQSSWSMLVGKTEEAMNTLNFCFHKKYLKSINPTESDVNVWCFPSFLLFQEGSERFMVSFEQDY